MVKGKISLAKSVTKKRGIRVLIAFFIFAAFLLINIFKLDVILYAHYRDKAYDQLTTTSLLKAERGEIYDANMNLLASTLTVWRIFVSPREIREKNKSDDTDYADIIATGLAEIFSLDKSEIYKKISNSRVLDVTIEKSASEEEYKRVLELIESRGLDDMVFAEAQTSRFYPEGTLAAHVLGFTGSDNQGLYGLEYYYNDILSGKDGSYLYAKDANGNAMPGGYASYVPAEDGLSIVTTIDTYIQRKLEGIIEAVRVNHDVRNRVTGIVMDTTTGAILGMATSTPFDPNSPFELDSVSMKKLLASGYAEGSEEYKKLKGELLEVMWSNKAVSETYEPGSTFKIITVASALDLGVADMNDTFSCHGYHTVGGWRIKCHKVTGHGSSFPLSYGLQMSCNPTMMSIAERIGSEAFYSYVKKFGYLEKSGIDLPSEARTIFHKEEGIGSTELATASFGQRFKVSIIGHLTAIASVANCGFVVTPYLVEKTVNKDGVVVSQKVHKTGDRIISEEAANEVNRVLIDGVNNDGGAKNARVTGYDIAAKTGTSQKFDVLDENGNSYLRISSTVAYASGGDANIAVIIVADEPNSTVKYGSVVVAPYISELLSDVLPYLEYESKTESGTFTVGSYVGMNISTVKALLDNEKVSYEIIGNGSTVLLQTPSPSVEISKELSKITLYTEKMSDTYVTVPALTGLSLAEANAVSVSAGLNLRVVGIKDFESRAVVVTQSIALGERVKRGTVITLTVIYLDFED